MAARALDARSLYEPRTKDERGGLRKCEVVA